MYTLEPVKRGLATPKTAESTCKQKNKITFLQKAIYSVCNIVELTLVI